MRMWALPSPETRTRTCGYRGPAPRGLLAGAAVAGVMVAGAVAAGLGLGMLVPLRNRGLVRQWGDQQERGRSGSDIRWVPRFGRALAGWFRRVVRSWRP